MTTVAPDTSTSRIAWSTVQPWLSTAVRLGMAASLIAAAMPKLLDIPQSIIAVRAYRILPETVVPLVGTLQPFLELLLAAFLVAGLFTRAAAVMWLAMMAAYTTGVIWAWAHGLSIDCGCFGGGGEVAEGTTNYPLHLLERAGFIALGAFLVVLPRSRLSLDGWMRDA
ncbi:MauE/DoxX family redox-associated membrane protein [Demequina phytophila]|uniref:MauE/DoxX family redox-associated membrane protein n=1 Tax=Demequina phytophila TaxID=1638981 RepID=UPI00078557F1|nr:MauE/DoxX family redox-associated membrane protein [Demequina phytophila]